MYCTCSLNNQWFQHRHSNQNMSTAGCNHSGSQQQIQSNGPAILKSCLGSTTSHSCLPNILSQSQNHLHCTSANQLPQQQQQQQPHSQNVTPWRYYCTCKNQCIFCSNSWWPTCPRLTASQSTSNCYPTTQGNTSTFFKTKENQLNMSNGNCSPAMSASPVPPAPPQPPPQRTCSRCRFTIADNQPATSYGNANNSYTGKQHRRVKPKEFFFLLHPDQCTTHMLIFPNKQPCLGCIYTWNTIKFAFHAVFKYLLLIVFSCFALLKKSHVKMVYKTELFYAWKHFAFGDLLNGLFFQRKISTDRFATQKNWQLMRQRENKY